MPAVSVADFCGGHFLWRILAHGGLFRAGLLCGGLLRKTPHSVLALRPRAGAVHRVLHTEEQLHSTLAPCAAIGCYQLMAPQQ